MASLDNYPKADPYMRRMTCNERVADGKDNTCLSADKWLVDQ